MTLIAIVALSAASLAWEITLTRLASATLAYHYAFVAVSLAVGGIGLGAALTYAAPSISVRRSAAWAAVVAAVAFLLVPLLLPPLINWSGLGGLVILALPPFIAMGAALTGVFRAEPQLSTRFYAADLLGAGAGAVATIIGLNAIGPLALLFILSAVSAGAGWLLRQTARDTQPRESENVSPRLWRFTLPVLTAIVLVASICGTGLQLATSLFGIDYRAMVNAPPDKTIVPVLRDRSQHARIIATRWDAFARTDVVATSDPSRRLIFTDGGAGTYMVRWNGRVRSVRGLHQDLETLPFLLGPHRNVLIIGSGGGIDILRALVAGAKHVTAVDWNAAAIAAVRREHRYNGDLVNRRDVTMVVDDGRHFLARSKQKYDTILLNLVYTGAAQSSDALAENYIFTTQAFQTYLKHLTPRGRIGVISHQALEGLRAFTTGVEALHDQGLPYTDAMQRTSLLMTDNQTPETRPTLTVIQRPIFNNKELLYLRGRASGDLNLRPLYVPFFYQGGSFAGLAQGKVTLSQWLQGGGYNVGPTTDNQPFFFDLNLGLPAGLTVALRYAVLLLLATVMLALFLRRPSSPAQSDGESAALLGIYAALLGIGFMCIEVPLIQRFILVLGEPTTALVVVLAAILMAGAVGSWVAGRFLPRPLLAGAPLLVALIALVLWFVLPGVQSTLLTLPPAGAIAGSVAILLPMGLALGAPFPLGLELASETTPDNIALLWAVSAVFSMLGSVLAALGAVEVGFAAVLLIGAGCYLASAVVMRLVSSRTVRSSRTAPSPVRVGVAGSRR